MAYKDEQVAALVAVGRLLQSRSWPYGQSKTRKGACEGSCARVSIELAISISREVCRLLACTER